MALNDQPIWRKVRKRKQTLNIQRMISLSFISRPLYVVYLFLFWIFVFFYSDQANKIYTFLQLGLTRGVQGMGQGLLEGVTGIIRQPIEVIILCEHK